MAITFPRALPEPNKIRRVQFTPLHNQSMSPTRGGLVQAVDLGPQLWRIEFTTATLTERDGGVWEAWLESLNGAMRLFKAWHPLRRYPYVYRATGWVGLNRAGGGAFDGTAEIDSVGVGRDTLAISTLPAGFKISTGDFVSFGYASGVQALHRVLEDVTASGAGEAVLPVSPIVKPSPPVETVCTFEAPWCKACVDPKTIRAPWDVGRVTSLSFSATQVIG